MDPNLLVKGVICKNFTLQDSKLTEIINRMWKKNDF